MFLPCLFGNQTPREKFTSGWASTKYSHLTQVTSLVWVVVVRCLATSDDLTLCDTCTLAPFTSSVLTSTFLRVSPPFLDQLRRLNLLPDRDVCANSCVPVAPCRRASQRWYVAHDVAPCATAHSTHPQQLPCFSLVCGPITLLQQWRWFRLEAQHHIPCCTTSRAWFCRVVSDFRAFLWRAVGSLLQHPTHLHLCACFSSISGPISTLELGA